MTLSVAGALVAAVAAAAARPVLWAIRFAFADGGRRSMLAYWLGLLAVSLPVMHALAASRQLPTIIIRKVPRNYSTVPECRYRSGGKIFRWEPHEGLSRERNANGQRILSACLVHRRDQICRDLVSGLWSQGPAIVWLSQPVASQWMDVLHQMLQSDSANL